MRRSLAVRAIRCTWQSYIGGLLLPAVQMVRVDHVVGVRRGASCLSFQRARTLVNVFMRWLPSFALRAHRVDLSTAAGYEHPLRSRAAYGRDAELASCYLFRNVWISVSVAFLLLLLRMLNIWWVGRGFAISNCVVLGDVGHHTFVVEVAACLRVRRLLARLLSSRVALLNIIDPIGSLMLLLFHAYL